MLGVHQTLMPSWIRRGRQVSELIREEREQSTIYAFNFYRALSIFPSVFCLWFCLSLFLSFCICLCQCIFVFPTLSLSLCIFMSPCLCTLLSICLPVSVPL